MTTFPELVAAELVRARELHPIPQHSLEESYGVLMEEIDEFWAHVKMKDEYRCRSRIQTELIHVAAMCQRAIEDNGLPIYMPFDYYMRDIKLPVHHSLHGAWGAIDIQAKHLAQMIFEGQIYRATDAFIAISIHARAAYMLLEPVEKPYREECHQ